MSKKKTRQRNKPLLYFFYHGDLHKKIHINRGNDVITTFNYREGKIVKYVYSDVRKNGEQGFTTKQVAQMLNRGFKHILRDIANGNLEEPQSSYTMDENRNKVTYFWSEKGIMAAHAYYSSVHRGRPRNDGLVTSAKIPSAAELRAMIRQGTIFYVKVGEDFVPTWKA